MIQDTVSSYDPKQNPYLDRRLRSDNSISFLGFIDELRKLWEAAGKKGRILRYQALDDDAEFPVITFKTLRRLVNSQFKEIKPRHRTTIEHPYVPGELVELKGQMFDVWVEFDIASTSAEEADELVEELDDFIQMYKGHFKQSGVAEITFFAQESDQVITDYRFPIAVRPIQYTLRFEKITPVFLNQLEQIYVQGHASKPQQSEF